MPGLDQVHDVVSRYTQSYTCIVQYCFDTWFSRMSYGLRLTQPERVLHEAEFSGSLAHLLKLNQIQNYFLITYLIYQFC